MFAILTITLIEQLNSVLCKSNPSIKISTSSSSHALHQAIRSGLVKPVKSQEVLRSKDSNISSSLAVSSNDAAMPRFSSRRRAEVVLTIGVRPLCRCHFSTTCAGDRPCEFATWACIRTKHLRYLVRFTIFGHFFHPETNSYVTNRSQFIGTSLWSFSTTNLPVNLLWWLSTKYRGSNMELCLPYTKAVDKWVRIRPRHFQNCRITQEFLPSWCQWWICLNTNAMVLAIPGQEMTRGEALLRLC